MAARNLEESMSVTPNLVTIFVHCYFRTKVIEGLIPQGIQVQAQVTLASQG